MVTILHTDTNVKVLKQLFQKWLPASALIAMHGKHTRKQILQKLPELGDLMIIQQDMSSWGVTTSIWHTVHISQTITFISISFQTVRAMEHFYQHLQTCLDITLGRVVKGRFTFEECLDKDYLGTVTLMKTDNMLRVYDAIGLAQDLYQIQHLRLLFFWVSFIHTGGLTLSWCSDDWHIKLWKPQITLVHVVSFFAFGNRSSSYIANQT